jgi:hypothetical protein
MKKVILFCVFLTVSLFACKKNSDKAVATISIANPFEAQILTLGQSVLINFTIDGGGEAVHNFEAKITNKTASSEAWKIDKHTDDPTVLVQESVFLTTISNSDFELEVKQISHEGVETTKKVAFKINL